jgi:hypothetical protein
MSRRGGAVRIHICTEIHRTPTEVWADVEDIASHVHWMADAESITFITETRAGVGTTFDCATRVGPIRLNDRMTITEWDPEHAMGVEHRGLVTGVGTFLITGVPAGNDGVCTKFCWEETLRLPWWLGGPIGELAAKPVLSFVWRRNLSRLKARIEG